MPANPLTQTSVTTWIPNELVSALDNHLAQLAAGRVGLKPSRQAWIIAAIKTALAAVEVNS